jgi:NAD(P)-dependent dehydrogenase (short-subunit alcohol dehydrogenase family)
MMSDLLDLKGRVGFVTGAGQGAGRAIALQMARHGAGGVVVNDFSRARAEAVVAEVEALGVKAHASVCDVGDFAAVRAAMDEGAAALGPIAMLVNNAGNAGPTTQMGRGTNFWESDPAEWNLYFHTNTFGVMNCCHAALPGMVEAGWGRIVTVVSDAGRVGETKLAAYGAAKAAAAGFVRCIAKEVGRYNITCNAISLSAMEPNGLDEEVLAGYLAGEQVKKQTQRYTIKRIGKPDDVAAMALFLCSDAAEWISGQTYPVNGGYSYAL